VVTDSWPNTKASRVAFYHVDDAAKSESGRLGQWVCRIQKIERKKNTCEFENSTYFYEFMIEI